MFPTLLNYSTPLAKLNLRQNHKVITSRFKLKDKNFYYYGTIHGLISVSRKTNKN